MPQSQPPGSLALRLRNDSPTPCGVMACEAWPVRLPAAAPTAASDQAHSDTTSMYMPLILHI